MRLRVPLVSEQLVSFVLGARLFLLVAVGPRCARAPPVALTARLDMSNAKFGITSTSTERRAGIFCGLSPWFPRLVFDVGLASCDPVLGWSLPRSRALLVRSLHFPFCHAYVYLRNAAACIIRFYPFVQQRWRPTVVLVVRSWV